MHETIWQKIFVCYFEENGTCLAFLVELFFTFQISKIVINRGISKRSVLKFKTHQIWLCILYLSLQLFETDTLLYRLQQSYFLYILKCFVVKNFSFAFFYYPQDMYSQIFCIGFNIMFLKNGLISQNFVGKSLFMMKYINVPQNRTRLSRILISH